MNQRDRQTEGERVKGERTMYLSDRQTEGERVKGERTMYLSDRQTEGESKRGEDYEAKRQRERVSKGTMKQSDRQ